MRECPIVCTGSASSNARDGWRPRSPFDVTSRGAPARAARIPRRRIVMTTAADQPSAATTAAAYGVHSEVGKLRKVMVHRPDLELKRLTPANHDDLLFDDVLWVRRARQQHDMFADLLRDRGTEVVYLEELLAETLAVPEAPQVGPRPGGHPVHGRRGHRRRGAGLPRAGRRDHAGRPPDRRPDRQRGAGPAQGAAASRASARASSRSARWSRRRWSPTTSSSGRCPTATSRATHRPGSTAASWSTRCTGRPAGSRPSTSRRSTASTPTSRTPGSSSGTRASRRASRSAG